MISMAPAMPNLRIGIYKSRNQAFVNRKNGEISMFILHLAAEYHPFARNDFKTLGDRLNVPLCEA